MSFSENLQYIRAHAEITQEQLAEQLEVSRQSVSKWESGASFPEMDTLLRLCDLYNVDLDTLLRGSVEAAHVSDTAQYDAFMNYFSRCVALSVGAILAGVGVTLFLSAMGVQKMLSAALLLLVITAAVVVMVVAGIQEENFVKKHPVIEDFYTEEERDAFRRRYVWLIAGGVGAILFGVVLMVLCSAFLPKTESCRFIASGVFLLIVAAAVTAFIYGGMQDEKYKVWKYNRDHQPSPAAKKRMNTIGTICAVIMLLAAAVYLTLGFTRNAWGVVWWLFPVGVVLCCVAATVLNPYKGEED